MKRGSVTDAFFYGALVFGLIIFTFIIVYAVNTISDSSYYAFASLPGITPANLNIVNQSKFAVNNFATTMSLVVGMGALGLIAAPAFLPVPAIFLPIGIIVLIATIVFFVQLQGLMPSLLGGGILQIEAQNFPILAFILNNLGWIILVVGSIILIIIYGRWRGGRATFLPGE